MNRRELFRNLLGLGAAAAAARALPAIGTEDAEDLALANEARKLPSVPYESLGIKNATFTTGGTMEWTYWYTNPPVVATQDGWRPLTFKVIRDV